MNIGQSIVVAIIGGLVVQYITKKWTPFDPSTTAAQPVEADAEIESEIYA